MPQGYVTHPFIPDTTVKKLKFVTYKYVHGRNILFLCLWGGGWSPLPQGPTTQDIENSIKYIKLPIDKYSIKPFALFPPQLEL